MKAWLCVFCCFLGLVYPLAVMGKPMGGKISEEIWISDVKTNGTCKEIGLYNKSTIDISVKFSGDSKKANITLSATVYKIKCANIDQGYPQCADFAQAVIAKASVTVLFNSSTVEKSFAAAPSLLAATVAPSLKTVNTSGANTTKNNKTIASNTSGKGENPSKSTQKRSANNQPAPAQKPKPEHFVTIDNGSAMYVIEVSGKIENASKNASISVPLTLIFEIRNPHGFLSAVDYPALVFYGIMTAVYAVYAIVWIVLMGCSYKDLVRLQFWVLAVILLGFLEKTFFVSEYSSLNAGESSSSSELFLVAEAVSAAKRALSRMLLVIVSLGFGTVKPRLGDSLGKVVVAGIAYFILALIDGVVRARMDTFHSSDTSVVVTLVLLVLLDCLIFYWIFSSIVATRMALRLRKNYVKLSMYNHFAYALIFGIVASVAFLIWTFVELNFPPDNCLDDWKEVWLRDCFWHILFAFILLIIMVIWRPSSNRSRFAYSLVNDEDIEEPEQGENKNFETLKMRTVSKQGSTSEPPPVSSSQVEDDLRWVEENLPTTALDKALPLLLDSDEEVMTTKFEISKMN